MFSKKKFILTFKILLLLFFYSCRKDKCKKYELTEEEKSFIPYNMGDIAVFRNELSGQYDTLIIEYVSFKPPDSDLPTKCSGAFGSMWAGINFSHLKNCEISIYHGKVPTIAYGYGKSHNFPLTGPFQSTISVSNITYNDIYTVAIDSNNIDSSYINKVPWKIDYSKSKGIVRLYLMQNNVWSKM